MDRYAVIGNPIAHSLSPEIHARFARATGETLEYRRLLAPLDGFAAVAHAFFDGGGRGANVTLPFKGDALRFAPRASERAREAGAANFLAPGEEGVFADNTDGAGLVRDLTRNLSRPIAGARILLIGAGGAARGVLAPLLRERPDSLVIVNRTEARARELAARFAGLGAVSAAPIASAGGGAFDLVLNATSASTRGEELTLPHVFSAGTLAYDMAYGAAARRFVQAARAAGAEASDGLGMLVEQAAESFALWRGKRPETASVLAQLRTELA